MCVIPMYILFIYDHDHMFPALCVHDHVITPPPSSRDEDGVELYDPMELVVQAQTQALGQGGADMIMI